VKKSKALVTLVSGSAYQDTWRKFCLPGWKAYADRYGYDIVALTKHIDGSAVGMGRPVHWQKLLIAEHPLVRDYPHVVWLDSDIAINPHTAPCIVEEAERGAGGIGVVVDFYPDAALAQAVIRRQGMFQQTLNQGGRTWKGVYRDLGFNTDLDRGFNAGVMVIRPSVHASVLRQVYDTYQQTPISWFENGPLSYHLMHFHDVTELPSAFNVNFPHALYAYYPFLMMREFANETLMRLAVNVIADNAYFLHFLGGGLARQMMQFVEVNERWRNGLPVALP